MREATVRESGGRWQVVETEPGTPGEVVGTVASRDVAVQVADHLNRKFRGENPAPVRVADLGKPLQEVAS